MIEVVTDTTSQVTISEIIRLPVVQVVSKPWFWKKLGQIHLGPDSEGYRYLTPAVHRPWRIEGDHI